MKCPKCNHDQKFKEGMVCRSCRYTFLFSPKQAPRISDNLFNIIIQRASGHNTRYFTANQLHVIFHKALKRKKRGGLIGCSIIALIVAVAVGVNSLAWLAVVLLIAFAMIAYTYIDYAKPMAKTEELFNTMLTKWKTGHKLDKLIEKPALAEPPAPAQFEDLYDYGVERIVILERDILVDLLVRNGWHAENKALVIAESGYPHYLEERALTLMQERQDLPVFLLHDATDHGSGMRERLMGAKRLPLRGRKLRDLGLFPKDVAKMPVLRKLGAKHSNYEVPLDMLGFGILSAALGAALLSDLAFSQLMDPTSPHFGGFEADFG